MLCRSCGAIGPQRGLGRGCGAARTAAPQPDRDASRREKPLEVRVFHPVIGNDHRAALPLPEVPRIFWDATQEITEVKEILMPVPQKI